MVKENNIGGNDIIGAATIVDETIVKHALSDSQVARFQDALDFFSNFELMEQSQREEIAQVSEDFKKFAESRDVVYMDEFFRENADALDHMHVLVDFIKSDEILNRVPEEQKSSFINMAQELEEHLIGESYPAFIESLGKVEESLKDLAKEGRFGELGQASQDLDARVNMAVEHGLDKDILASIKLGDAIESFREARASRYNDKSPEGVTLNPNAADKEAESVIDFNDSLQRFIAQVEAEMTSAENDENKLGRSEEGAEYHASSTPNVHMPQDKGIEKA